MTTVRLLLALALCLLLAGGCGGPDRRPPPASGGPLVLDLAAALAAADIETESAVLEMGRPATRRHLIAGWGRDEADAAGPFVWSVGGESVVELFAAAPTDFELVFTCRPFAFAGAPEQRVSATLNGVSLGEVVLVRGDQRYRLAAPAAAVRRGANRLVFRFAYHRRPVDVAAGARDDRRLSAAWREIALVGLGAAAAPRLDEEDRGRLVLPAGTEATYYFALDGPAELTIESLSAAAGVELLAAFRTADSEVETRRFAPGTAPVRWRLRAGGPAIGRLTLTAARAGAGGVKGWLRRFGGKRDENLALLRPVVRDFAAAASQGAPGPANPAPASASAAEGRPEKPNVLIYLIDTLRADHLGTYGYPLPTSPNIDRFAADGIVFLDAQAQSSWTRPAVASLFTGLDPGRHRVYDRRQGLPRAVETLAEILRRAGWDTAGFVTNGNVAATFGFDQGFDQYHYLRESGDAPERHRLSDRLNARVFDWLEARAPGASPFFLYVHATDPHAPYVPVEVFRSRFAPGVDPRLGHLESVREIFRGGRETGEAVRRGLVGLYDAEVAFNDLHFGRLLDRLREEGLYDSTLVVLLSDHGEEFLDHGGWEHGRTLFGEQLRVPLILRLPAGEQAGGRVEATARQVDLLPTILARLGLEPPAAIDGVPLLGRSGLPRPAFADLKLAKRQVRSVATLGWKLVLDASPVPQGARVQLYHLAADPRETAELAAERPFEGAFLSQLLRRRDLELGRGAVDGAGEVEVPEELRRQLEALGYL